MRKSFKRHVKSYISIYNPATAQYDAVAFDVFSNDVISMRVGGYRLVCFTGTEHEISATFARR